MHPSISYRWRFFVRVLPCFCTLAFSSCSADTPPTGKPPPDPPSGAIRPDEVIPYEQLEEHLGWNTPSRMRLYALVGRVISVRGPVWQIEQDGAGGVLRLGSARISVVQANFFDASDLQDVCPGQEVVVIGTFQFRGPGVILENAQLER